ncbi:unknown [Clostridium sp. CAG:253]|nr:unknown [Clostridium sp. CAG:253]
MGGKVIETEAKKMYNRGISEGRSESLKDQIKKKLAKGKEIAQIADEIEESEETVLEPIKQIEAEK